MTLLTNSNLHKLASKPVKWLVENFSLQELNELKNNVQFNSFLPVLVDFLMGKISSLPPEGLINFSRLITFSDYSFET